MLHYTTYTSIDPTAFPPSLTLTKEEMDAADAARGRQQHEPAHVDPTQDGRPSSSRRSSIFGAIAERFRSRSRSHSRSRPTSRPSSRPSSRPQSPERITEEEEVALEEQVRSHMTLNFDGLPIPPSIEQQKRYHAQTAAAKKEKEYLWSRRKSTEISGPYADALESQLDHMEKLRRVQSHNNVTHNVDGLPIPPPVKTPSRRSSIVQILPLDKSLLLL